MHLDQTKNRLVFELRHFCIFQFLESCFLGASPPPPPPPVTVLIVSAAVFRIPFGAGGQPGLYREAIARQSGSMPSQRPKIIGVAPRSLAAGKVSSVKGRQMNISSLGWMSPRHLVTDSGLLINPPAGVSARLAQFYILCNNVVKQSKTSHKKCLLL